MYNDETGRECSVSDFDITVSASAVHSHTDMDRSSEKIALGDRDCIQDFPDGDFNAILPEDEAYMREAIHQASLAAQRDEVPVGAVIVRDGKIIAAAGNSREEAKDATCHAECTAIREACRTLGGWRLLGCTMYVTLEPCPMCAGAAINARLERIVIGAADQKAGAFGSVVDLNKIGLNHKPEIVSGVLKEECVGLLREFFRGKRGKDKSWKGKQI